MNTNVPDNDRQAIDRAVREFEWTTLNALRAMIDDLDIRAQRLEGIDVEWDAAFRRGWFALEEVYAVMCDRNMSEPDVVLQQVLFRALDELKKLV